MECSKLCTLVDSNVSNWMRRIESPVRGTFRRRAAKQELVVLKIAPWLHNLHCASSDQFSGAFWNCKFLDVAKVQLKGAVFAKDCCLSLAYATWLGYHGITTWILVSYYNTYIIYHIPYDISTMIYIMKSSVKLSMISYKMCITSYGFDIMYGDYDIMHWYYDIMCYIA